MVIAELKGGLGNQLFQYAAAIAMACHSNTIMKADITNLGSPDEVLGTYRRYTLSKLKSPPEILSVDEKEKYIARGWKKIWRLLNPVSIQTYTEKHFHYDASFWNCRQWVFLRGNFQSEKYFKPYEDTVRKKLQFDTNKIAGLNTALLAEMKSVESLSLHIRRGDYVSNKIASDVLGVLPVAHYEAAYAEMLKYVQIQKVFVFSDDIEWAKQHLGFGANLTFVENEGADRDIADFVLMQHCKHNIIANSSFSWWAAYLNSNPGKIVVAPKRWFNKAPYDTKDLIPESWIRI